MNCKATVTIVRFRSHNVFTHCLRLFKKFDTGSYFQIDRDAQKERDLETQVRVFYSQFFARTSQKLFEMDDKWSEGPSKGSYAALLKIFNH